MPFPPPLVCRITRARIDIVGNTPAGQPSSSGDGCAAMLKMVRSVPVVPTDTVRETVNAVYLSDSRRVLATLIRLLGDFDVAEEALHDAFRAALEQWPRDGVPANPRAWLVSTGRFKAIDSIRRRARFDALDDVGDAAEIAV